MSEIMLEISESQRSWLDYIRRETGVPRARVIRRLISEAMNRHYEKDIIEVCGGIKQNSGESKQDYDEDKDLGAEAKDA
jgi:hypothetical protein